MLRVSWEKPTHPLFKLLSNWTNPKMKKKVLLVERPSKPYDLEPIKVYIYYCGTPEEYKKSKTIILNVPGGGFVSMPPPTHECYYSVWASKTKLPIIAIDYVKSPEAVYPYAIEECFDLYRAIVESGGGCLGIDSIDESVIQNRGEQYNELSIALTADSAYYFNFSFRGANIACGVMFKILESPNNLPRPKCLVLSYACLDFNISSWMPSNQSNLFRIQSISSLSTLNESKSHFLHSSPLSTIDDSGRNKLGNKKKLTIAERVVKKSAENLADMSKKETAQLTMTSRMSYFNDRILTPDLMRAMAILYLGPNNNPDFAHDYYLSPMIAPEHLLAKFPKLLMVCGEKDPLIDDTILFAARIRQAKGKNLKKNKKNGDRVKLFNGLTPLSNQRADKSTKNKKSPSFTLGSDDNDSEEENEAPTSSSWKDSSFGKIDEKLDVDIKIFSGIGHGFLIMIPFLMEAKDLAGFLADYISRNLKSSRIHK